MEKPIVIAGPARIARAQGTDEMHQLSRKYNQDRIRVFSRYDPNEDLKHQFTTIRLQNSEL